MSQNLSGFALRTVLFCAIAFLVASCSKEVQQRVVSNEFTVRTLQGQSATFTNSYPAVIQGRNDAEIRPKISGFITRVAVQEGAKVRRGQVLFQLDDASYRAAVSQALAAVNSAKSMLATAQLNYDNSIELKNKNIIGETGLLTASNSLATAKATLAQANAALEAARENLSYCTVLSPSNGVIGSIQYRVGNLVSPSIAIPMTAVSDIDQMYVYFSISERQALQMNNQVNEFPEVELKLANDSIFERKGKVAAMSGIIDKATGSIRVRADFPNPNHKLRSGGSGSILVPYQYNMAILVPQSATIEVLNKKYVYIVGSDNKVIYTPVEVASLDDGQNYVVTNGLKIGDRIVLEGVNQLKNNMVIKPINETSAEYSQDKTK